MIDSVMTNLNRRVSTPIYGVLAFTWLAIHWEFVYTMFFVDQNQIWIQENMLKNEYLQKKFFDYSDIKFYVLWFLTLLLTWLIIWKFPRYITIPAFKKDQEDKAEKMRIRIKIEKGIKKEQEKLEDQKINTLDKTLVKVDKEQEVELKISSVWSSDYKSFTKTSFYNSFHTLLESLYEHGGLTRGTYGESYVEPGLLAYLHSNNLVEFDESKKYIELTDKGKFFVSTYSTEKSLLQK